MSSTYNSGLGENEEEIVDAFDELCKNCADEFKLSTDQVERALSYIWEYRREKARKDYDNWLSANEMGPYAGR